MVATRHPADVALGRVLHSVLFVRDILQIDLAPKLGLDQSTLSKKLRGIRPWTFAEFLAIAELLSIEPADLLADMSQRKSA